LKTKVFLDSGAFIALLNRSDRWHLDMRDLFSSPVAWATSLAVVSETHSWFLHRSGEEAARQFQALLRGMSGLVVHELSLALHNATLRMLDKLRGHKLTYVDASSLVLLEQHKTSQVWGTDHHLSLLGAKVLPQGG
jgi:predicted nucleic acid-binding protein